MLVNQPRNTYHQQDDTQGYNIFLEKVRRQTHSRCLKITENVSFNIASEASNAYILSGQKLIKNAKNGQVGRVFERLKLAVAQCYQIGQF